MEKVEIYSKCKLDNQIKQWRKKFPLLSIERINIPTEDCYVVFEYLSNKTNCNNPFEAAINAQKGFIEGWIKKPFNKNRIFQPTEFEGYLQELTLKLRDEIGTKV